MAYVNIGDHGSNCVANCNGSAADGFRNWE